ncbi:DUF2284 domain-containing protein [Chloroflexota bacterium]
MKQVPNEVLQRDLEKYRQRAIELGARDAKVITASTVVIDERVRAKCTVPLCPSYGTNSNCPPYSMSLDFVRKMVHNFHYGILISLDVSPDVITGKGADDRLKRRHPMTKNYEIVAKIEAEAFYDGYYLAQGFAGGSCKPVFCPDNDCSALVTGQGCRYPLRGRASMEGIGINAFAMATGVGWDMYSVGQAASQSEVPHGMIMGLVLIY